MNKILELITKRIHEIENELKTSLPEDYKQHLGIEQTVFRRLKNMFEWEMLSSNEKQYGRLSSLAIMRKAGAIEKYIEEHEQAIKIYDLINLTLPYIKVINLHNKLDTLEAICQRELEIIDSSGSDFRGKHVTKEEIETAFQEYFEKVQPYRMNMYKECYEKIEALYEAFKSLPQS